MTTIDAVIPVSHAKPELKFVNLDLIDLLQQVRTTSGLEDAEILELAESIKDQGLLQPVLLRPNGPSFILIAGERRCRAARLAGYSHVPALIGDADDSRAATMQLVENVQRVDLSILELAAALRKLADEGKTLSEICSIVKKSKPWVSKHLAASIDTMPFYTQRWMINGDCEDLESVLCMVQIERLGKWFPRGDDLADRISAGKAGRKEARELLTAVKEELAAEKADKKAAKQAALQGSLELDNSASRKPEPQPWNAYTEMKKLENCLDDEEEQRTIDSLIAHLDKEQLTRMTELHKSAWNAGKKLQKSTDVVKMRGLVKIIDAEYSDAKCFDSAAFVLGIASIKLTLRDLATEYRALRPG